MSKQTKWVNIGKLADLPRRGLRFVSLARGDIADFLTVDEDTYALEDKYPHKGGPLSQGIVHGCRVTCPLHNWVLDLKTGKAVAPDEGETTIYGVEIRDGEIFLQV